MKKIIVAVIFMVVISPVFAQNNSQESSSVYYVNLSIEKIFPSSQGYVIFYRTQGGIGTLGIPNSWFREAAGKANLVNLPAGSTWPTLSIFYNDGEISHIRLYVQRHRGHSTWGTIPIGTDLSRYFSDGDTLNVQF
jgi:hypothetical protein